jgi:CubicO group peptidase (beta-lactamase class C family)
LLYLRNGRWGSKQIIPEAWVEKNRHADEMIQWRNADAGGYENLWWLEYHGASLYGPGLPSGSFMASGAGVHIAMVIPSLNLVIVNRVDNEPVTKDSATVIAAAEHTFIRTTKMGEIIRMILAARVQ